MNSKEISGSLKLSHAFVISNARTELFNQHGKGKKHQVIPVKSLDVGSDGACLSTVASRSPTLSFKSPDGGGGGGSFFIPSVFWQ
ncbi:uncharacterized [Tachysurus ichikawai]